MLAVVLVTVAAAPGVAVAASDSSNATDATDASNTANATLVVVYPDPVERGDPGEFVLVRFPRATNTTGWTLTDGTSTARLPNRTLSGTVALSTTPEAAAAHADAPVVGLDGRV
ncbi:phospholipase, partial [Halobacteriales archaeon QS_9_70_65]